ncbi:MAG: hypothetical protein M3R15_09890 [Acidobacteriota bacterium]|nr:hypothetical protein [Acidobacteriota bacterium]
MNRVVRTGVGDYHMLSIDRRKVWRRVSLVNRPAVGHSWTNEMDAGRARSHNALVNLSVRPALFV